MASSLASGAMMRRRDVIQEFLFSSALAVCPNRPIVKVIQRYFKILQNIGSTLTSITSSSPQIVVDRTKQRELGIILALRPDTVFR
jgi:hypothetical protein